MSKQRKLDLIRERYPLDISQMPESSGFYTKGHHGGPDFAAALKRDWNCKPKSIDPLGYDIRWVWWRVNPPHPGEDRTVQGAQPHTRGASPVTVVYETEHLQT